MNKLLILALCLFLLYLFLDFKPTSSIAPIVQSAGSIPSFVNVGELAATSMLLKQFQ